MAKATEQLVIMHSNDLHSHFETMPRIAEAIRAAREQWGAAHVLAVDCGDHMDRVSPITEGSQGAANLAILNACGYEAVALGNNEGLTFAPGILPKLYTEQATFPVLGSNIREVAGLRIPSWMVPHAIIEKSGLRIGLIGVTADFNTYYHLLGWHITDPLEAVREEVQRLRDQVDVIVVLSHIGLPRDKAMAQEISGIDVILGAHTHHLLMEAIEVNGTLIAAAGKFGEYIGEVCIDYDRESHQVTALRGRCLPTEDFAVDPVVAALLATHRTSSDLVLRDPVALLTRPMAVSWQQESPLGNLLAEGVRRWTGAEIGIVNSGQLLHDLDAGAVTRGDLLDICPSPINPCRMLVKGRLIQQTLEEALLDEYQEMPIRGFGFRGKVLGGLCLSGMEVAYRADRPAFNKITAVMINGHMIDPNRDYIVGTLDMFTFGVGYLLLKEGREIHYYLPEFIRDVLGTQLQSSVEINKSMQAHWTDQV